MNNLTSLLSQNYKSLEQPALVKLLEDIEKVVKDLDKGCEYCTGEIEKICNNCQDFSEQCYANCKRIDKYSLQKKIREKYNFCPMCGRNLTDLRKEVETNG